MLSFTVLLANDYMRGVAELASNSLAIKLTQAGCEVATRKSKVLRDSVSGHSCSCGWPLGVQASRAERNLGTIPTSGKRASTAVRRVRLEEVKRARQADQEDFFSRTPVPPWKGEFLRTGAEKENPTVPIKQSLCDGFKCC